MYQPIRVKTSCCDNECSCGNGGVTALAFKELSDKVDANTDALDTKQDTLIAGDNITIEDNVISSIGGAGGVVKIAGGDIMGTSDVVIPKPASSGMFYVYLRTTTTMGPTGVYTIIFPPNAGALDRVYSSVIANLESTSSGYKIYTYRVMLIMGDENITIRFMSSEGAYQHTDYTAMSFGTMAYYSVYYAPITEA